MNNLKAKHILGWMIFCMIMPIIPVVSYFVFLDHVDMRDGGLILIFPGLAVLLAIPLSLLNLFLFKRNLSTGAAKRTATIPFGFRIICSGTLFFIMILFILYSSSPFIILLLSRRFSGSGVKLNSAHQSTPDFRF